MLNNHIKMRILVINNYSMKQFLSLSDAGICPAHHCWGIDELRNNSDHCCPEKFYHKVGCSTEPASGTLTGVVG